MSTTLAKRMAASAIALLLLFGIGRAATSRYQEQLKQLLAQAEAERKRSGLSDDQVAEKYPTPTVSMARMVRATPGTTADIVVKGRFAPGTKFLFDNDMVEVISESLEVAKRTQAQAGKEQGQGKSQAQNAQAEMEKLAKTMENPNLSMEERMKLAMRAAELAQQMAPGIQEASQEAMRTAKAEQTAGQGVDTYRVKIRISKFAAPGLANLHAVTPVSGKGLSVRAVWIAGKYEWQLTSSNGWRIKMTLVSEGDSDQIQRAFDPQQSYQESAGPPAPRYRAEFYRGSEAQPFRIRDVEFSYPTREDEPEYHADMQLTAADLEKQKAIEAEIEKLDNERTKVGDRLEGAKSEGERERIRAEMEKLQGRIEDKQKENDAKYRFGTAEQPECKAMTLRVAQGTIGEGSSMDCGTRATPKLTGSVKFLGP